MCFFCEYDPIFPFPQFLFIFYYIHLKLWYFSQLLRYLRWRKKTKLLSLIWFDLFTNFISLLMNSWFTNFPFCNLFKLFSWFQSLWFIICQIAQVNYVQNYPQLTNAVLSYTKANWRVNLKLHWWLCYYSKV